MGMFKKIGAWGTILIAYLCLTAAFGEYLHERP